MVRSDSARARLVTEVAEELLYSRYHLLSMKAAVFPSAAVLECFVVDTPPIFRNRLCATLR